MPRLRAAESKTPNRIQPMSWQSFVEQGISVQEWARERGFTPQLVYHVLSGERKCLRGQSHLIAKELGMK